MGDQVSLFGNFHFPDARPQTVWLVHPICNSGLGSTPLFPTTTRINVVLDIVDESGEGDYWIHWGESVGATFWSTKGGIELANFPSGIMEASPGLPDHPQIVLPENVRPRSITQQASILKGHTSPLWVAIQNRLGSISWDGGLNRQYLLGTCPALALLHMNIILSHAVGFDAKNLSESRWIIPALQTSLVEQRDGSKLWLSPSGESIRFEGPKRVGGAQLKAQGEAEVKALGNDLYRVTCDSTDWFYLRGQLVLIMDPILGRVSVRSKGGLISNLRTSFDGSGRDLLHVDYDELGNPRIISINGRSLAQLRWQNGSLDHFTRADGTTCSLEYRNSMLAGVDDRGRREAFEWRVDLPVRSTLQSGASKSHLLMDGVYSYRYKVTDRGIEIGLYHKDGTFVADTVLNPVLHTLRQTDAEGDSYLVKLDLISQDISPLKIFDEEEALIESFPSN
jgi:hypothetical protein